MTNKNEFSEIENKNLTIYNSVRAVPENAKKQFNNGRFSGTDIKPMFRIQQLTKVFGPCGQGWYIDEVERWTEKDATGQICVFIKIHLFVKYGEEWSYPILGYGSAMVVANEKKGPFFDDDAVKKAYTDSISVACRSLGVAADVYWSEDATKYAQQVAIKENFELAVSQLKSAPNVEELKKLWDYYGPYYSKDNDFRVAYATRERELKTQQNVK